MLDLVIKNGRIIDGTGNPWFLGDVGVKNGEITHVGTVDVESKDVLDAKRQVISPGFIDGHSHSDLLVIDDPCMDIKLQQGVTTEVVGNCGLAPAPFLEGKGDLLQQYIGPVIGETAKPWSWSSIEEYIQTLVVSNTSENVATYVAHGALRIAVMGFENRPATRTELSQMKHLLNEGMKAGAIGLSIGLLYSPGRYSSKEELAELCEVLPAYNGLLSTHIRGEGNNLIESVKEVIWIAERAGISLHISHLKAAGKRNWGMVSKALEMIEDGRARGLDVTCDVYPYEAGSTMLSTVLPPWTLEGGMAECLDRIRKPEVREKIKAELSEEQEEWDNLIVSTGWDSVVISAVSENNQHLEGQSIEAISQSLGQDPADTALDLLLKEDGNVSIVFFHMSESDVEQVLASDYSLIISDSLGCSTGKPHPRTYGTFPRIFETYVREKKTLNLEQAIRKVTSFPVQRFLLGNRGLLKPGYAADITIFNPETIKATATYQDPIHYPTGVDHVFVNGIKTVSQNENLKTNNGSMIRAQRTLQCSRHH
ncbi:N-acyl-D-amino-acid deacylase family protein [Shouchella shacheensis]|uniref:N-acyl-D-amino-acid deacylase family protein n=1 Tax=Shouchella shacheensis TaxID=1649580 RepID=UPI00073FD1DF|nr:D-aminoacylase [Shouchella shacheensis]